MQRVMPRVRREWVDEILVVDGGSTDGTLQEAETQGLPVVVQQRPGRGEAFRVGLNNTTGDVIVYFSPDGNEAPEDIPRLVAEIQRGYDMVIASRFSPQSRSYDATWVRRVGNRFFTLLTRWLFGAHTTDAVNGFRAVTRECMEALNTTATDFAIELQMTSRAGKKGYRVGEIPTVEGARVGGKAKLHTLVDGWKYLVLVAVEVLNRRPRNE